MASPADFAKVIAADAVAVADADPAGVVTVGVASLADAGKVTVGVAGLALQGRHPWPIPIERVTMNVTNLNEEAQVNVVGVQTCTS